MKIFLDILNENPIARKCITVAIMAAKIISFNRFQLIKNADNEGIVIIIAIIVPFIKIPFEDFLLSFNFFSDTFGNKNQKYFIFGNG
jgi:hypothetical protein